MTPYVPMSKGDTLVLVLPEHVPHWDSLGYKATLTVPVPEPVETPTETPDTTAVPENPNETKTGGVKSSRKTKEIQHG